MLAALVGGYQIGWMISRVNEPKNTGLDFCQVLCRLMGMRVSEPRKNRHRDLNRSHYLRRIEWQQLST